MIDTGVQTGDGFGVVVGSLPAALSPAPVFSVQPGATILYQDAGRLQGTAATVSPSTSLQWQMKQPDNSWSDVAGQTAATLDIAAANASRAGTYRLKAINGNNSAVSSEVTAYFVYLGIQNDSSPANGSAAGTTKVSNAVYTEDGPAGARYYSAFYRLVNGDTNFTPPGASTARAVAAWQTTNATVASASSVSGTGQLATNITAGTATLTATVGNLSSVLNINF